MKKLLMIPGPTPVVNSIRAEMARETIAFGDPVFVRDYKWLIDTLRDMFSCDGKAFVFAGTGTLAMETAIANSLQAGDAALLVSNGFFGDRFIDICERKGIHLDVIQAPWGTVVQPEEIRVQLEQKKYRALITTQVDTSTGVLAPIQEIGAVAAEFDDLLFIVDGVCSVGAEAADMKECGIDVLFTGSQKAFGVSPGLAMLWANERALARRKSLGRIPEYYCDYELWIPIMDDPAKYFATPAVNLVWALAESVRIMEQEGLTARYERHKKTARAMQKGFEALGFSLLAEPSSRAHTLSNLLYPEGVEDAAFRSVLAEEGVQAAGGVGQYAGRMLRVGHMGNIDHTECVTTLAALERALRRSGAEVPYGAGVAAYQEEMAQ